MEGKKTPLNVVKVGGAVVEDPRSLDSLLQQFAALSGRKVLVHGGGRRATDIARRLGIESVMVGGRRVTDPEMLKVVTMVYGGLINKDVVAKLQARGVNAIGLTGADMDVIRSHRRGWCWKTAWNGTWTSALWGTWTGLMPRLWTL